MTSSEALLSYAELPMLVDNTCPASNAILAVQTFPAKQETSEHDFIFLDHCYSKPISAHIDTSNAKSANLLYMQRFPRKSGYEQNFPETDAYVDVDGTTSLSSATSSSKTKPVLTECERHCEAACKIEENTEEIEDHISKTGWSGQQQRLFSKCLKLLNSDRLSKLSCEGNQKEAMLRRLYIDQTSQRFRQALASVSWDQKLCQWIHGLMMDHLNPTMLATYLNILQTLKAKIPSLIDKMIVNTTVSKYCGINAETLHQLLKRPWDPVTSGLQNNKSKKLPGIPLIVIAPSGPTTAHQTRRQKFWLSQLSQLGKVFPVSMHTVNGGSGVSVEQCLEHMIGALRSKVVELKSHFPNRPIILFGWDIGALVASHVSLVETVSAIVCLGFPFYGLNGSRGDVDDPLVEVKTPILFVIGQFASLCKLDDLEMFRERINIENFLIVLGGCDDNLRLSKAKKKQESVTQCMVDRVLMDKIAEFLENVIAQNGAFTSEVQHDALLEADNKKRGRKSNSDSNSCTIEFFLSGSSLKHDIKPGRPPKIKMEKDSRSRGRRNLKRQKPENATDINIPPKRRPSKTEFRFDPSLQKPELAGLLMGKIDKHHSDNMKSAEITQNTPVPVVFPGLPTNKSTPSIPRTRTATPVIVSSTTQPSDARPQLVTLSLTVPKSTQHTNIPQIQQLLTSMAKSFSGTATLVSTTSTGAISPHPEPDHVQAIQKLQFHDFPLTTATLTKTGTTVGVTQAKILSKQFVLAKPDMSSPRTKLVSISSNVMSQALVSSVTPTTHVSNPLLIQNKTGTSLLPTTIIERDVKEPLVISSNVSTLVDNEQFVIESRPSTFVMNKIHISKPSISATPSTLVAKDVTYSPSPSFTSSPISATHSNVTGSPSTVFIGKPVTLTSKTEKLTPRILSSVVRTHKK